MFGAEREMNVGEGGMQSGSASFAEQLAFM